MRSLPQLLLARATNLLRSQQLSRPIRHATNPPLFESELGAKKVDSDVAPMMSELLYRLDEMRMPRVPASLNAPGEDVFRTHVLTSHETMRTMYMTLTKIEQWLESTPPNASDYEGVVAMKTVLDDYITMKDTIYRRMEDKLEM